MQPLTLDFLSEQLQLAQELQDGRNTMFEPQDLPGRYGRVIKAVDRVLAATRSGAVVGGGWAVWRHGFFGRVTQDVNIVVAAEDVQEVLPAASVSGFQVLSTPKGRWPKMLHKDTGIEVDLLPEGERPGVPTKPAPTTIPHPQSLGATRAKLKYIELPALIELKLTAGRARDEADVVELLRVNPDQLERIRRHLEHVHADYVAAFDRFAARAAEQQDQ